MLKRGMTPLKTIQNSQDPDIIILNAFLSSIMQINLYTTVQDLRSFNVVDLL